MLISFLPKKAPGPACLSPLFNHYNYHPNSDLVCFPRGTSPTSSHCSILHPLSKLIFQIEALSQHLPCLQTFSFSLPPDDFTLASKALHARSVTCFSSPVSHSLPQNPHALQPKETHGGLPHPHLCSCAHSRLWHTVPCGFCLQPVFAQPIS